MTLLVGLTGGIGSGKSAVADRFAQLGVPVVDTDVIAHTLTAPGGDAMPAIRAAFGSDVIAPDGALDRTAMRRRVFADPAQRIQLEAILHPLIRATAEEQMSRRSGADISCLILVVPLLAETGTWRERVDRVLVVDCPPALQIARVMARNGLARNEVEAILAAQATREQRLGIADDVIVNDGGLDTLHAAVDALHRRYLDPAQ